VGAVEVDVLVAGGPDVRQDRVVDVPPGAPQGGDGSLPGRGLGGERADGSLAGRAG